MPGELPAVIGRYCLDPMGQRPKQRDHCSAGRGGAAVSQPGYQHQPRLALYPREHAAGLVGPDDGVKLPVADLGAVFNVRWALSNAPLVGNVASAAAVAAATALLVGLLTAQRQVQASTSLSVAVDVEVNRLMADVDKACNLFWAVLESQIVLDRVPGLAWRGAGVTRAQGPFVGSLLGEIGIVASAAAIAVELAVNGTLVKANTLRNSANGKALGQAKLNLVSLLWVEVSVHVLLNLTVVGR